MDVEENDSLVLLSNSMTLEPKNSSYYSPSSSDDDSIDHNDHTPSGRYFLGPDSGPKCFNCNKSGHISRECPETQSLPCFLCGGIDHQRSKCPEEVCYNCQMIGHHSRDCTKPRTRRFYPGNKERCSRCQLPGHLFKDCSLNWRRYVYTTPYPPTSNELNRVDKFIHPSCYECGEFNTHWGDECSHRTRAEYSIFHTPNQQFLSLAHLRSSNLRNNQPQCDKQQHQSVKQSVPNQIKPKKNIFDHQLPSSTSKTNNTSSYKKKGTPPNRHYNNSSTPNTRRLPTEEEQYLRSHSLPKSTKKKD